MMFTPFRLLSKRHRTVSSASVDAVDGTVVSYSHLLYVPVILTLATSGEYSY